MKIDKVRLPAGLERLYQESEDAIAWEDWDEVARLAREIAAYPKYGIMMD